MEVTEATKKQRIAGWIVSGLVAAFMLFSASGKFRDFEGKEQMFAHLGWTTERMVPVGVVELLVTALYLIPQTAFVGAILLAAYLGGATSAHARVGDPFLMPPLLGVIAWVGYGLRRPEVIRAAFRKS